MPAPIVARAEYQINTAVTGNSQRFVDLAAFANGGFALGWDSTAGDPLDLDARLSHREAGGEPVSTATDDEVLAQIATIDESAAAVAGLIDNRVVYVWQEEPASGEVDIYAQIRNYDGTILTPRFLVTTVVGAAADDQQRPEVVGLDDGNFLVAWIDTAPATDTIAFKIFDIGGSQLASGTASTNAPVASAKVKAARLENGNLVLTWLAPSVPFSGLAFAIVDPSGAIVQAETDVNPEDNDFEFVDGDVVALPDGNFVVLFDRLGVNAIQGRLFDEDGVALTQRFDISTGLGNTPAGTALSDGRFMVVYERSGDIFGQMMFADGSKDGGEFTVSNASGNQFSPDIETLADGRVVVSWDSDQSGNQNVYAEIYDPRESGLYTGASSFADDWIGTGFTDQVLLGAGNDAFDGLGAVDFVYGEGGGDTLIGGTGDDRLYGGSGLDQLFGGADNDFLYGQAGGDQLFGEAGIDTLDGGDGDDTLYGGGEDDVLTAGDGNDIVNGEPGADILRGGTGIDTMTGNIGADDIRGGAGDDNIFGDGDGDTFLSGEAGADAIEGGSGNDRIDGGSEDDTLSGQDNNDNITGGLGNDTIFGGTGDDGNGLGILRGEDGDDEIFGQDGIDRLEGGDDNDTLEGGLGNDVLVGGAGLDVFVFTFENEGNDRIDDWVAADDQIAVGAPSFNIPPAPLAANRLVVGAAPVADQAFAQFLYNTATGQLSWDEDGTGVLAPVNITRLLNGGVAVATLTAADFDVFT